MAAAAEVKALTKERDSLAVELSKSSAECESQRRECAATKDELELLKVELQSQHAALHNLKNAEVEASEQMANVLSMGAAVRLEVERANEKNEGLVLQLNSANSSISCLTEEIMKVWSPRFPNL
jgi:chromosome segregation ATPase